MDSASAQSSSRRPQNHASPCVSSLLGPFPGLTRYRRVNRSTLAAVWITVVAVELALAYFGLTLVTYVSPHGDAPLNRALTVASLAVRTRPCSRSIVNILFLYTFAEIALLTGQTPRSPTKPIHTSHH